MNRQQVSRAAAAVGITLLVMSPTAALAFDHRQAQDQHGNDHNSQVPRGWVHRDNEGDGLHGDLIGQLNAQINVDVGSQGNQDWNGQTNLPVVVQHANVHLNAHSNQSCNGQTNLPVVVHENEHANVHVNLHSNGSAKQHMNKHVNIHLNSNKAGHVEQVAAGRADEHVNVHLNAHVNEHVKEHVNTHVNVHVKEHVNTHVNVHVNEHINAHMNVHVKEHVNAHMNVHVNEHVNAHVNEHVDVKVNLNRSVSAQGDTKIGLLAALDQLHLNQSNYLYAYFENLHLSSQDVDHIATNVTHIDHLCHAPGATGQPTAAQQQESWRLFLNTLSICHLNVSVTDQAGHPVDVFHQTSSTPVTAQLTDNIGHKLATVKLSHPTSPTTLSPVMHSIKQAGSSATRITPQQRSNPAITGKLPQTATSDPLLIAIGLLTAIVGAIGLAGTRFLAKRS